MAFRFWRRIKIAPGMSLNLSKSGGSLSFGPRGAKVTVGSRGRRATVGIPGTGLFYTTKLSGGRSGGGKNGAVSGQAMPAIQPPAYASHADREDRLTLSFFKRLVTPAEEKALVDGCRELVMGDEGKALKHLEEGAHLSDGAFLAGFLALKKGQLRKAETYLTTAAEKSDRLGRYFSKYGISAIMSLPITDEVSAHVGSDLRGVLLALVEVYQRQGRWQDAMASLERLRRLEPDDVVVKLSLAELLWDLTVRNMQARPRPDDKTAWKKIVRLSEGIENETPIHAALLLYKGRALRGLGLLDAARETLTAALRRRKNRSQELLRALRYERALVYEALGQRRRARDELEKLYAEAPDYEDVAAHLGL